MTGIKGENKLESIDIKSDDNEAKTLQTDYVLGFFGLIMQLGPIANWGLNINKKCGSTYPSKIKSAVKKHKANVEVLLEKTAGIAEHPDTLETIEKELKIIAEYDDELEMLKKYF